MKDNEILFQALGPIGASLLNYKYIDTITPFTKLIWTDNTIKQQPNESIKNLIVELYKSISISSSCVYGIPKNTQYPVYACTASSSASAYNFYVSSIISNLSALPTFLNIIRSNIEGIINGTTPEAVFYDTCFSLLKINNFTHFFVEVADTLTNNFSDTLTIQPLLPQIDQISQAVKEIVSKSDQLRSIIVNKTATPQDVLTYNNTINSFINIIPQYTQTYSSLLVQLQNEFTGIYSKENENKASDKKNIENEFDLFVQKMKKYVNPIQKVVLLASILVSQKPIAGICDNLLFNLKNIVDNTNIMIVNYSKLFHFRGEEFDLYKKIFLESQNKNLTLLKEIKTQFTTILNTDTPQAFQTYMNEELKTSLDVINNEQNSIFNTEFEKILKLIQNDPRSVVFSPILASNIPSNQLSSLSLKSIKILSSIINELRSSPLNFKNIKDKLNELHPSIKYLLTVIYNDTYISMTNEMNKLKSKKKKKVKPSNFSLQPEIVVLNQKKSYIQNLFVSFDESLHKLSPDSPLLQIIQDNCALKAILLSVAISTLETNPEIQNEITKIHLILSDYLDNYFIKNEKKINEVIQFFDNGKNIPNEQKSQYEAVIKNLKETIQFSKKVFNSEKKISEISEKRKRIDLIKIKITEYEKLSLLLSSLQYMNESYFPDNKYHEIILNLQQNMTNVVKSSQKATQLHLYQNFMNLSKIFALVLNLIKNILPHSSYESTYLSRISGDLNQNRSNMISLSTCGIGFDPESSDLLKKGIEENLQFIKEEKNFYKSKVETEYFKTNLEKSFKILDEFYQATEQSIIYLEISQVDYNIPQRECIGPILKHFTLHINYTLDKYALSFINNLPTVVQFAMNLNDLLRELDNALRYIPQSADSLELQKVQFKFECPGKILFQRTSEIPLLIDYFKDDKILLNIALQNKKEIIKEAIINVMNYLSKIVKHTTSEICKFEDIKLQKTKFDSYAEQSQKEYKQHREEQLQKGQNIEDYRNEVREKDKIESKKEEEKIDYKEPLSININPIFGMGIYLKCGFNPDKFKLDQNPEEDIDLSIDIESLSDFSSLSSINSVFKNAETNRSDIEATKIKDKNIDLISDLRKQLMPPDYLLTAIQCGLLKETQDNKNDEDENENDDKDNEDPLNALKIGGDDDNEDDNEKSGDDFDSENDPILGNKQLVEDDDDFFESCSDDDDEEEEEKHKGFFPWS